jgi:hypothetical protein
MGKDFFEEEQCICSFWLYFFTIIVYAIVIIPTMEALYSQVILGVPYGDELTTNRALLILLMFIIILLILTLWLFARMKLIVRVNDRGLSYRYPPFIAKERLIAKEDIEKHELRKYSPIREYGGWGIRYGWKKGEKAYNVRGNTGMQLYLKDGKKILFGTQQGESFKQAMDKMMSTETNG